uniref:NADH-ubiquinone oxidoreductase chain 6 n=1 Tax=Paramacrosteles nigromaculatus TaxID=2665880 RepID=A0A5Q2MVH7_9HEMI|nr:NADH dehydrogenase subunit 6 [Paramacrosteles nigromaculatus]QGG46177.1 NADH dehydrogenase subunit 6 [Paramacrosteles nigromaculatus]
MKTMLIKLMITISTTIMFLKTPMSMGVMLIIQTTLSTLVLSKIMPSSWMPMIIFLMMIGGLLILFMYMSSIASNEKFTPNFKMLAFLFLLAIIPMEEMYMEIQINESQTLFISVESMSMSKIYNKKMLMITMLMFIYLLLAMIVVTKIIKIYKGPLRSK